MQRITNHDFEFDKKEKQVAIIENGEIKKEDVSNFFKYHFIDNIRKIDLEYVPQNRKEENLKLRIN